MRFPPSTDLALGDVGDEGVGLGANVEGDRQADARHAVLVVVDQLELRRADRPVKLVLRRRVDVAKGEGEAGILVVSVVHAAADRARVLLAEDELEERGRGQRLRRDQRRVVAVETLETLGRA